MTIQDRAALVSTTEPAQVSLWAVRSRPLACAGPGHARATPDEEHEYGSTATELYISGQARHLTPDTNTFEATQQQLRSLHGGVDARFSDPAMTLQTSAFSAIFRDDLRAPRSS